MTPGAAVEVTVKLNFWDLYSSSVFITRRQHLRFFSVWFFLTALCGLFAWFAYTHSTDRHVWKQILWDCSPLALVFLIQLIVLVGLPMVVAVKGARSEIVRVGYRYTFKDDGISVETMSKRLDLKWPSVIEVYELPRAFLVRTGRLLAYTVPLRCFSNDAEVDLVRQFLRANVANAAHRDS